LKFEMQTLKPGIHITGSRVGLKPGAFKLWVGRLDSTCTAPHRALARQLHPGVAQQVPHARALLHDLGQPEVGDLHAPRGVAVQVAFAESKGLKPGLHFMGFKG
jgi:hypothetical protein